jgi:hypothetical protein
LCSAVAKAPPGKVLHFLLGNNVCCEGSAMEGADALASLIVDKRQTIQTWYLAGNAIDSDAIGTIARAFQQNDSADALWLKRNPIKAQGAAHLGSMLLVNTSLQLLDLNNTGLLDDGVAALLNPLIASKERVHLRHLYLGANGISDQGAETISRFIEAHPYALETLYLQMNPLGSSGAVRIANALTRAAACLNGTTPALKRLSLASCRLDDTALAAVVRAAEACGLVCLDVGYYKSTRALGERPNEFSSEGAAQLAQLARKCLDLRFLGVAHAGCEPSLALLRQTSQERGDLWLEDGIRDNKSITRIGTVHGGMSRHQVRVGIRHPAIVEHIDSVYRGKM